MNSAYWRLYVPKLVTVLRDGYDWKRFVADFSAGWTVAIVALPLSMALAIASGVTPDRGLFTAIVAGFLYLGAGRVPLPDRRAHGRLRRCRVQRRRAAWL